MVPPPPEMIPVLIDTAKELKGPRRRLFMAKTVRATGRGGQRWAQEHLGWCRETIRKGTHELDSGLTCADATAGRRRKRAEERLPKRLDDIRDIADAYSQADPDFQTDRLFTRISAAAVRRQLIQKKGYTDQELPTQQTINAQLNDLGYRLSRVAQGRPQKRSRRPMPSSSGSGGSTSRRMPPRIPCESRSTPRPPSPSGRSPAGAVVAPGPKGRITTSSPRRS